jgi:hypothetical protein
MNRIVTGLDAQVAHWAFSISNTRPMLYNMACAIVDDKGLIQGAFMFTGYNGSEIEVHYYGPGTLKRRILKEIFIFALKLFNVNRLTVRTRKASMARGVEKLGAVYEGEMRRVYGPSDGDEHKAVQYAFMRERMEEIAGLRKKACADQPLA